MRNELFINGVDAYVVYGATMGDGFLDALESLAPMKDYIENNSRTEHGRRITSVGGAVDSRELTLVFNIEGDTKEDYETKKNAFKSMLYGEDVTIRVQEGEYYHLKYRNCVGFGREPSGTFSKVSVKFVEPNPMKRTKQ